MLKRSTGNLVSKNAGYRRQAPFEGSMRQVRGMEPETLKTDGFRSFTRRLSRVFRKE